MMDNVRVNVAARCVRGEDRAAELYIDSIQMQETFGSRMIDLQAMLFRFTEASAVCRLRPRFVDQLSLRQGLMRA